MFSLCSRQQRELREVRSSHDLSDDVFSPREFLHFDFFIGPSNLALERLPCFVPTQQPIVYGYAQAFKEGTHFRGHPVSLVGEKRKIWVVVSKHIGKVSDKAIMVCV